MNFSNFQKNFLSFALPSIYRQYSIILNQTIFQLYHLLLMLHKSLRINVTGRCDLLLTLFSFYFSQNNINIILEQSKSTFGLKQLKTNIQSNPLLKCRLSWQSGNHSVLFLKRESKTGWYHRFSTVLCDYSIYFQK